MTRTEPFATVHKGVRVLLFDVAKQAARIELASDSDVDLLTERIDGALDLVDEHEGAEHEAIVPILERADRRLARRLVIAHGEVEALAAAVRRQARGLALAPSGERGVPSRSLLEAVNDLTVKCLTHMHEEETIVSTVLWGALGERELAELTSRTVEPLVRGSRRAAWRAVLEPAVTESERIVLFGRPPRQ